ncbi:hypothetical protein KIF53_13300 [Chromobacterium subtsugae]|uniref:Lipoprotein n=1 Tax=Chromobacterium subtsugae TaxID=251747 RepID=A0ABS7FEV7_9NEIS|nr:MULTISPECIES: hypothetical protein [Chromobacterium]KUM03524.1 hypothetical protein Cv017_19340 [Chromobacterium subtsugae]MBW7567076.1 hypothetical protein [Chromobacterium subtsugae]MBW8288605.1 hypothetical protein [Chromobacterium subtsugae]WSE90168.1 hypothetical protein U6115_14860 [Chromobacterium subtsugae]WVH58540.1 hypothetical protein U6151_14885 [Chromobacterium subtsugae]
MSEIKKQLHQQHIAANDKYCYFLLAAAGACIAYATEKSVGVPLTWPLLVLGAAIVMWGLSFYYGCYWITNERNALWHNMALLDVQEPLDKVANRILFDQSSKGAKTGERRQFRLFIIGGICFIVWRVLTLILGRLV